jgi:hypothetical protein
MEPQKNLLGQLGGPLVDIAILAALTVLGALRVIPSEFVVGALCTMLGARAHAKRVEAATPQPPADGSTPPGASTPGAPAAAPKAPTGLARLADGSTFVAVLAGLAAMTLARHKQA